MNQLIVQCECLGSTVIVWKTWFSLAHWAQIVDMYKRAEMQHALDPPKENETKDNIVGNEAIYIR